MPHNNKTLLQHPEHARVAWHDAKKHATLLRMLLSNIRGGTYASSESAAIEAWNNVEIILEEHALLLDTLSIISRKGNDALQWKRVLCDPADALETAKRLAAHALDGKGVVLKSSESCAADPTLFSYVLHAAIVVAAKLTIGAELSCEIAFHHEHVQVSVFSTALPDTSIPPDAIERAINLSHMDAVWQSISLPVAGIDAVVQCAGGDWGIAQENDRVTVNITL